MFFIHGFGSSDGPSRPLHTEPCPGCGSPTLSAFTRFSYQHVFWIPLFPTGRDALVSCSHCEQTFSRSATSLGPNHPLQPYSAYHFAGLFVLVPLMLFAGLFGAVTSGSITSRASWRPTRADPNQLAFVLLADPRLPSTADVLQAYASFGPAEDGIREGAPDGDGQGQAIALTLRDDEQALVGLVPAPVPDGEAEGAVEYSISAMRDGWQLPPHRAHLVVALRSSSDVPPVERVSRFTSLLAAVVQASSAVGVYWGAARATHDAALFTKIAADPGVVPRILLWTGLSIAREPNGRLSLLSLGMDQLELPDLLLTAPKGREEQAYGAFFDFLGYVASRGHAIGGGDTVAFTRNERLPVRYVPSPVDPDTSVCSIDLR